MLIACALVLGETAGGSAGPLLSKGRQIQMFQKDCLPLFHGWLCWAWLSDEKPFYYLGWDSFVLPIDSREKRSSIKLASVTAIQVEFVVKGTFIYGKESETRMKVFN